MPRSLTLYTFAEKSPNHGQDIFLFRNSDFYGSIEPQIATVEYTWIGVDEYGDDTGEQILFDPEDPSTPLGCRLEIMLVSPYTTYSEKDLWCPATDIEKLYEVEQ